MPRSLQASRSMWSKPMENVEMHLMFSGILLDHRRGALLVERQQDGVDGLRRLEHLVDGDLGVIAMGDDVVGLPGAGHDGIRQRPGDQDFLFAHGTVSSPGIAIVGETGRDPCRNGARLTSAAIRIATLSSPSPGKLRAASIRRRGTRPPGHFRRPAGWEHAIHAESPRHRARPSRGCKNLGPGSPLPRRGAGRAAARLPRAGHRRLPERAALPHSAPPARCGRARPRSTSSSDAPASTSASGSCAASSGRRASSTRTSC